jgi:hypothetical protein
MMHATDNSALLAHFARHYSMPTTAAEYARRLRDSGRSRADSAAIAAAAFPTTEAADTAAGAGWSVVYLAADGTAEVLAWRGTFGEAADTAAAYSVRVVVVPDYSAAAMVAAE